MKLIFENWRRYLNEEKELLTEVSFKDALVVLDKASRKIISGQLYDTYGKPPEGAFGRSGPWWLQREILVNSIKARIPHDIEDGQKATVLLWLIRLARRGERLYSSKRKRTHPRQLERLDRGRLETFFHWQRFMSERDLNKIKSLPDLKDIVDGASDAIKAYQEKQSYADASEGTEILVDDADDWKIAIIHNKGAACQLGKGTDWCTAAPGLDYFENYYEPDDPLFYLEDRYGGGRYQFHYGSGQFMDEEDVRVDAHLALKLHELLVSALGEQINKYPIVKKARDSIEVVVPKRWRSTAEASLRSSLSAFLMAGGSKNWPTLRRDIWLALGG